MAGTDIAQLERRFRKAIDDRTVLRVRRRDAEPTFLFEPYIIYRDAATFSAMVAGYVLISLSGHGGRREWTCISADLIRAVERTPYCFTMDEGFDSLGHDYEYVVHAADRR